MNEKGEEILKCLNGSRRHVFVKNDGEASVDDDDEYVDLWKLRELAISRGGLLSPMYRKCAWPKLLGIQEEVLLGNCNTQQQQQHQQRLLDIHEKVLIKSSVTSTFYNIHEYMNLSRQKTGGYWETAFHTSHCNDNHSDDDSSRVDNGHKTLPTTSSINHPITMLMANMIPETPQRKKGTYFPPSPYKIFYNDNNNNNHNNNNCPSSPPPPLNKLLGRLDAAERDDYSNSSTITPPATPLSFQPSSTVYATSSVTKKTPNNRRTSRKRKATNRVEQSILYNVITHVLQVQPTTTKLQDSVKQSHNDESSLSSTMMKHNRAEDHDESGTTRKNINGDSDQDHQNQLLPEPKEQTQHQKQQHSHSPYLIKNHPPSSSTLKHQNTNHAGRSGHNININNDEQDQKEQQPQQEQNQHAAYHYFFDGLQDLVALFIINVECPSIAKLMLIRLASFQLKDALYYPANNNNQPKLDQNNAQQQQQHYYGNEQQQQQQVRREQYREDIYNVIVKLAFIPLLKQVDEELHQYMIDSGLILEIPMSWIFSWFLHDIHEPLIISRFIDVFLASHALMPVYMAVAMITYPEHRYMILQTKSYRNQSMDDDIRIINNNHTEMNLRSVVSRLDEIQDKEELTTTVEDIIQLAVSYMSRISPMELISITKKKMVTIAPSPLPVGSITMFQDPPPSWATVSFAQSDWTLLRLKQRRAQTKLHQQKEKEQEQQEQHNPSEQERAEDNKEITDTKVDDGIKDSCMNNVAEVNRNGTIDSNDGDDNNHEPIIDNLLSRLDQTDDVETKYPLAYVAAGVRNDYQSNSECNSNDGHSSDSDSDTGSLSSIEMHAEIQKSYYYGKVHAIFASLIQSFVTITILLLLPVLSSFVTVSFSQQSSSSPTM